MIEQGNLAAHEILMITDTVQCRACCKYAALRHANCESRRILLGASDDVKKQVLKNAINWFIVLTTSAFFFFWKRDRPEGKQLVAAKTSGGTTERVTITKVLRKKKSKKYS